MKKLLDENPDTPCTLRGTDFAAKDVFDAARAGDALAAREVDEMTDTLGHGAGLHCLYHRPRDVHGGRRCRPCR